MRFIETKIHGILDYIVGLVLIIAPWLFGFYRGGAESWVPIIIGAGMILQALFTDYEAGVKRVMSMKTHLNMDLIAGIFLAVSPWLFGFADFVFWPHLLVGIFEVIASLTTKLETSYNMPSRSAAPR